MHAGELRIALQAGEKAKHTARGNREGTAHVAVSITRLKLALYCDTQVPMAGVKLRKSVAMLVMCSADSLQ